jgi:serine/threonine protein kinase
MAKLQPGQTLGPYQILEQIGEGGMATVYKAYQPSMDRNVAIKVLPSQLAESAEFARRFQQEARIIAKLEHPHILPVFDYGESEGVTYLVMRYLDAGTLRDKMEMGRPLPLDEIDHLFTQLADALSYAHSYGIIHRDLKPSNALIDSQGNLFLTDFGIAKMLESASPRLTQTDAVMGTPAYISPEQAQATKVNQRSDIYSLGIILYEMITGRVPFVAETPLAVILKHVSDPLPPPSTVKPDVPEAVEKVILKALAKNPEDRFATVSEFLSAWKRALDETKATRRPVEAAPASIASAKTLLDQTTPPGQTQGKPVPASQTGSKARGWAGWAAGCLVVLCVLLVVGGGGVFLLNAIGEPGRDTTVPTDSPPTADVPVYRETLFQDDFSDSTIWGILDEATASVQYEDNRLRLRTFRENWVVWSNPSRDFYSDIHVEVTAYNNDGKSNTAFGVICHQQGAGASYYYGVVTPSGNYVIALAQEGETDVFLTNDNQWGYSDLIAQNANDYRIGMDCGYGVLSLYVDGQLIDSAYDSTYGGGSAGVIIWSGTDVDSADVSFDDFLLQSLE